MNKRFIESMKESMSVSTQDVVISGLLIATDVVLTRFVSIQAWQFRIGFGFVPIVLAGMMLGPFKAGIVAALADVLGATLFPAGTFFPGFTLTACFVGVLYGIFLYKKQNKVRIILPVLIHQCILSLILNTLWLSILYGSPFLPLFASRLLQTAIMLPVEYMCVSVLCSERISQVLAYRSRWS